MLHRTNTRSTVAAFAAAVLLSLAAGGAGAVTVDPFDSPLSAGDSTNGSATAEAFEDFGMTALSTTAADDLLAEISFTINPYLTDLGGNPANDIAIGYSINGGAPIILDITTVDVPTGTIGAGGLALALSAGDSLSFIINGTAGQSGNIVTFAVETAVIPLPAALPLFMAGLAGLGFVRRRKQAA